MTMKLLFPGQSLLALSMTLFALTQVANADEQKTRVEVKEHDVLVFKSQDSSGSDEIRLDSDSMGFRLSDLQEGETRTALTDDGRSVTVAKANGEISLLLPSGRTINLPEVGGKHGKSVHILKSHGIHGDGDEDFVFDFDADIEMPKGITISSTNPLDDNAKQAIRDAIQAAGVADPVHFSDHQVWIKTGDANNTDVDHMVGEHRKMVRRVKVK